MIFPYEMSGETLALVDKATYLGVEATSNLSWGPHINKITAKATQTLNLIRRNLHSSPQEIKSRAYTALVRPTLEYSSSVWDPHQQNHIKKLDGVQRKAARFATRNYIRDASVTAMQQQLGWPTLQQRRFVARATLFYKAVNHLMAVTIPPYFISPTTITRGLHQNSLINVSTNKDSYAYSFMPRTARCWNILPIHILTAQSVTTFKNSLWRAVHGGQIVIVGPRDRYQRPRLGSCSQSLLPVIFY